MLFKGVVRHLRRVTAIVLLLLLLTSMTGCNKHFVVIKGTETVVVPKAILDQLLSDNEQLLLHCGK